MTACDMFTFSFWEKSGVTAEVSCIIAPYSSLLDCTTRTTPNSPIPSAGKGRYYTPKTEYKAYSTLIILILGIISVFKA